VELKDELLTTKLQPQATLRPALAHHWVILKCRSRTRTFSF